MRYVQVVQIEVDDTGRILAPINEENRIPERDIENMPKPIPFVRYGIVDRGKRNHTVYSNYDLQDVIQTCTRFNETDQERRAEKAQEAAA